MENRISASLGLPSTNPNYYHRRSLTGFDNLLNHFDALLLSTTTTTTTTTTTNFISVNPNLNNNNTRRRKRNVNQDSRPSSNLYFFSSTSISLVDDDTHHHHHLSSSSPGPTSPTGPTGPTPKKKPEPTSSSSKVKLLMKKNLSVLEKAVIGASAGGIAGAFTYVCLLPLDTIKTKLQAKGATEIYSGTLDAITKTFQEKGILGFYRGVSAVIIGSTASSAIYFGTCEFGKSVLTKFFPPVLIPPAAGAMGNIVSSAVMVPKELITQRMQTGAPGRSWEVLLRILEKDGILGLYSGYSATLLRNLPAGVLSYSSFEYLKSAVLSRTGKDNLEPFHSVCCGALAGAISASITTPLDVVKTRLMTQVQGEAIHGGGGVSETVKQILTEEGWVGLTRGMGPRVLHSACFAALGYFAFETARLTLLHQYLHHKVSDEVISAPT